MTPFAQWLDAMRASGLIKSDNDAGRLLGVTDDTICTYKLRGIPPERERLVLLACQALAHGLKPWASSVHPMGL